MLFGTCWELQVDIDGFLKNEGFELSTQAARGRKFMIISRLSIGNAERVKVCLLEDGYVCWFDLCNLLMNAKLINNFEPISLTPEEIKIRISNIIDWMAISSERYNEYLWGGTIGPNFDCSGLIQSGFASQKIWIPRDAYQQERFCKRVDASISKIGRLLPGDLLFFGNNDRCSHVGLHIEKGFYWHSSGRSNGYNGIGKSCLSSLRSDPISSYYQTQFRSAGRVMKCYNFRRSN